LPGESGQNDNAGKTRRKTSLCPDVYLFFSGHVLPLYHHTGEEVSFLGPSGQGETSLRLPFDGRIDRFRRLHQFPASAKVEEASLCLLELGFFHSQRRSFLVAVPTTKTMALDISALLVMG
jgi:hypothetical protein